MSGWPVIRLTVVYGADSGRERWAWQVIAARVSVDGGGSDDSG